VALARAGHGPGHRRGDFGHVVEVPREAPPPGREQQRRLGGAVGNVRGLRVVGEGGGGDENKNTC
jgi:hypothetical protein